MARPIAPRFEIIVLKDKSVSDRAQVPAGDAVVNLYRAGATVVSDVTVPVSATPLGVAVYDTGMLAGGDVVRVGTGSDTLYVASVAFGQAALTNNGPSGVFLAAGTRLVPINNRPNAYMDPLASVSLGNWLNVDPNTGRCGAYLSNDRIDYDIVIPGQPVRFFSDWAGAVGRSDERWIDVRDLGRSLQSALSVLPADGGIVFLPRGQYVLTSGIVINTPNVTIVGEGSSTTITPANADVFDLITVNQPNFQMRDLTLDGAATQQDAAGKSCLVVQGQGAGVIQKVTIKGGPRYGLFLNTVANFIAEACHFDSNKGSGARVESTSSPIANAVQFVASIFSYNGDRGCEANNATLLSFLGCTFDANFGGTSPSQGNGLDASTCFKIEVLSSFFLNSSALQVLNQFVLLTTCQSAVVDACWFDGGPTQGQGATAAVRFAGSSSSRLSNCTGKALLQSLAIFDASSRDCVEFGNSEIGQPLPRLSCLAANQRLIGMSRQSLMAPNGADLQDLPLTSSGVLPGALAWLNNGGFVVWNGTQWKAVTLT